MVNIKEKSYWNIISFSYKNYKIFVYYIVVEKEKEKEIIDKIGEITLTEEKLTNSGIVDGYLIDPTEKELQELFDKDIFKEIIVFEKLK